ncbi:hypothetical protein F0U62_29575 [Cystobacter fuscus]|uniref:hypothetical protein n=1 Tax=Cystobacter fuscus TaxID=43 RepID=UPI002B288372|nr:hypothetical protein F0U62_29575 [Cystobacter fuscus]
MMDQTQVQIISELSRDLVLQVAPGELPRFEETRAAYFEDPDKVLRGQSSQDEILGFGLGTLLTQMTPAILAVATQVVTFLVGEVKTQLKAESTGFMGEIVKRMFKRFKEEPLDKPQPPGLAVTPEMLRRVRETTLQNATRLHLPQEQAAVLADAVVGSLSLSPTG